MAARFTFPFFPGTLRGAKSLILKAFFAFQVLDFKGYFFLARLLLYSKGCAS
jgi:hypothetical protein